MDDCAYVVEPEREAMNPNPIIRLEHIFAAYERKAVLEDVCLNVYERDFLGIIGPNGGGKTTLVKLVLGLLRPVSGSIRFYQEGKEMPEISMGYLPQYTTIDKKFPISVYDVVLSGLNKQKSLFRSFTPAQHGQVRKVIARMGLEGLERRAIGQLSGGQLQRALLGRALVSNPQVIILDEPNTYIDKRFEARLYELLEEINRECAIILVSHDIGAVLKQAKSIAFVNHRLDYRPCEEVTDEWIEASFNAHLSNSVYPQN